MTKKILMAAFAIVLGYALGAGIRSALAQEAPASGIFYGVMCYSEAAAIKSALAFQEGGLDLQDEVVDHLINVEGDCIRLAQAEALRGFVVYEGEVVGDKQVLGIAPRTDSQPLLFGLVDTVPAFVPKRGA